MTPGNGRPGAGAGGRELRDIGHPLQARATETYPVVQRTGIRFFRRVTNAVGGLFAAAYNLFTCDWIAEKVA